MRVVVSEICRLSEHIRSFILRSEDSAGLASFTAGAHIVVNLDLPASISVKRKYSIVSDPADSSHYEIAVLREVNGAGGSEYMHTRVHVGDVLEISEPVNLFTLVPGGEHNVLLAGGIGITPLLSMAHTLNSIGASFDIHYAARTPADHLYRERLEALAAGRAHFYHSEGARKRPLDLKEVCARLGTNTHVYACGPLRFLEGLRRLVDEGVLSNEALHQESFGAGYVRDNRTSRTGEVEATAVLAKTGRSILVRSGQSILTALDQSGIRVPYDCMRGECGMCAVDYCDGKVVHKDRCLSDEEHRYRICLCVSEIESERIILAL